MNKEKAIFAVYANIAAHDLERTLKRHTGIEDLTIQNLKQYLENKKNWQAFKTKIDRANAFPFLNALESFKHNDEEITRDERHKKIISLLWENIGEKMRNYYSHFYSVATYFFKDDKILKYLSTT